MRVTFTLVSREREKRGNGVKAKNPSERENRLLSRDNKRVDIDTTHGHG
jgi:hypothetical protein